MPTTYVAKPGYAGLPGDPGYQGMPGRPGKQGRMGERGSMKYQDGSNELKVHFQHTL